MKTWGNHSLLFCSASQRFLVLILSSSDYPNEARHLFNSSLGELLGNTKGSNLPACANYGEYTSVATYASDIAQQSDKLP